MSHQLRRLTAANYERRSDFESSSSSSPLLLTSSFLQPHHSSPSHQHSSTTTTTTTTSTTTTKVDNNTNTHSSSTNTHFKTKHCFPSGFDRIRLGFLDIVPCGCGCFTKHRKGRRLESLDPMSSLVTATRLLSVTPDNNNNNNNGGKKNHGGQQKIQELQREVSVLQNMLNHEEKVREVLQQVHNRKPGMAFTVPDNMPPRMKEVLAELVMVEDEIVGLETQIEQLRKDVKTEQEATKEAKSKQSSLQLRNTSATKHNQQRSIINNNNTSSNDQQPNVYETRALHFISKAINGDYSLTDFTINEKNTNITIGSPLNSRGGGNSSPYIQPSKQSGLLQENKAPKRSGILKPSASPLRNFRDPTPFKPKERSSGEARADPPQKSISRPAKLEESNGTKWQPNKLSENIMKCLILIYVRLMRISRQSELEKSGPISRSMYSSLSFRTEPGVSLSTSLMKESKQQDPYGIFDVEGAVPRDIGPYKNLVVFNSSCLDPKYVSNSSSIPLFQKLKGLFNSLQKVDLRPLTDHQKLAFWINIYNACIMHGFLKFSVPSTPEKLLNLLNKATLNVGGKVVNAQAIERCILRKPTMLSTKEGKEAIIHELYGLQTVNPNVIFTLCCGTRSSPAVRIYTGEGVTSELEKSKLEYLQASISVTNSRTIWLPELLIQNMNDFAKDLDSLVEWVCHQMPTAGSLRKSIVDCFRGNSNSGRVSNAINIEKMPYDFECQYLLQV